MGLVAGILAGIVKLGWEVILPPRTPSRNATNPPQELLQQLGIPSNITHLTYQFTEQSVPWVSFIIHFGFSITIALIYIVLASKYPKVTIGYSAIFGIIIWLGFHIVIMPITQTIPTPIEQPIAEHISEFFGHILWMMVIEMVRRYYIYSNFLKEG